MTFKKGDLVIRTKEYPAVDSAMKKGGIYIVSSINTNSNIVFLEDVLNAEGTLDWFNCEYFELVEQKDKNYRHISPDTLIPISIDGVESEVPLGDLVHAQALLGTTSGFYGAKIWEAVKDVIDPQMDMCGSYSEVDKADEQDALISKFFIDLKKEQQKEDIKKNILTKETELKLLQNLLKALD